MYSLTTRQAFITKFEELMHELNKFIYSHDYSHLRLSMASITSSNITTWQYFIKFEVCVNAIIHHELTGLSMLPLNSE